MNTFTVFLKVTAMFAAGMLAAEIAASLMAGNESLKNVATYLKYPVGGGVAFGIGKLLKVV